MSHLPNPDMKKKLGKINSPSTSSHLAKSASKTENIASTVSFNPNHHSLYSESIKWGLTFILSILGVIIVTKLVDSIYNPNLEANLALAKSLLISGTKIAKPEPKEKLMIVAAILSGTVLVFLIYGFLKNKWNELTAQSAKIGSIIITVLLSIGLIYLLKVCFEAVNPFNANGESPHDKVAKTNYQFYFLDTFIYKHSLIFGLVLYPTIYFSLTHLYQLSQKRIDFEGKITRYSAVGFALILMAIAFTVSVFEFPITYQNKYDLNAVLYSTMQVYHGDSLLVDNFTNTYGLYPHFIVPFLKVFGLSITTFTGIMSTLMVLCFLSIYYFLAKNISNKLIVLLGFTSIFFNSYLFARTVMAFNPVFSAVPIRWLFPCLLLAFSGLYFSKDSKFLKARFLQKTIPLLSGFAITPIKVLSFLFFSLGILWSPDTGTFTLLGLVSFYSFQEIDTTQLTKSIIKIIVHLLTMVVCVVLVISLFSLIIKLFYGTAPDILQMFSTINVFSNLGFGMLPMPTSWHLWMVIAVVYLIGIIYSVVAIYKQNINSKSSSIFLLTVMGILLFLYYQGRSHNWNLFSINFPFFMLLSIFANDLLKLIRSEKVFHIPFGVVLILISFSIFQIFGSLSKFTSLISSNEDKITNEVFNNGVQFKAKVIDSLTEENEKIALLTGVECQSLLHTMTKTASSINPGYIDLFTNESFDKQIEHLTSRTQKIFLDLQFFGFDAPQLMAVLNAQFELKKEFVQENDILWYFEKRKENKDAKKILNENDNAQIHELFCTNFNNKILYGKGKSKPLELNTAGFTIETIFKPVAHTNARFAENPTVMSNAEGETGFSIEQTPANKNQYLIGFGTTGMLLPINPDTYNYIAIQINNNFGKAYVNGSLIGTVDFKLNFRNSKEPVFVGNKNNRNGYFFGDIYEVKVKNGSLNEVEVKQNALKVAALK